MRLGLRDSFCHHVPFLSRGSYHLFLWFESPLLETWMQHCLPGHHLSDL
jgi:hypothetical protein